MYLQYSTARAFFTFYNIKLSIVYFYYVLIVLYFNLIVTYTT
jgi:hypothetical protein